MSNNVNNRYSRHNSFNRKIHRNCKNNPFNNNRYWEKKVRRNLKKKLDLEKRTDRKNIRYTLLYNEIFTPLYENIVDADIFSNSELKNLIFTGNKIYSSNHYEEGLEHLEKGIDMFSEKFKRIKEEVNAFNIDINNFQDSEVNDIISDYFVENGFNIIDDTHNTKCPPRTIIKPNLSPYLKSYWYNDEDFKPTSWKDENLLRIKGGIIASFSNDIEKENIIDQINNLKNLDDVKNKIDGFKNELKRIIIEVKIYREKLESILIDI